MDADEEDEGAAAAAAARKRRRHPPRPETPFDVAVVGGGYPYEAPEKDGEAGGVRVMDGLDVQDGLGRLRQLH